MIVALIGCDCSGKSTCFNKIDKSLGTFVKGVQIKKFDSQFISNLKHMAQSDHLYIFDRIQIVDDFVYSPIFNGGSQSDLFNILDDIKDIARECTFIYFTCPAEILINRMHKRGDEYVNPKDVETIIKNYSAAFEILQIQPIEISTNELDEEQTLAQVTEIIKCKMRA